MLQPSLRLQQTHRLEATALRWTTAGHLNNHYTLLGASKPTTALALANGTHRHNTANSAGRQATTNTTVAHTLCHCNCIHTRPARSLRPPIHCKTLKHNRAQPNQAQPTRQQSMHSTPAGLKLKSTAHRSSPTLTVNQTLSQGSTS